MCVRVVVVVVVVVGKGRKGAREREGAKEEVELVRVRRSAREGAVVRGSSIAADEVWVVAWNWDSQG